MTHDLALGRQIQALRGARVLCVGDVMLDRYVYGAVARVSPEAPIPILHVGREHAMLGGAGNVARNLVSLGTAIDFVAVVGADEAGGRIAELIADEPGITGHLVDVTGRQTGIKTRFIAGGQQLLRTDEETVRPIGDAAQDEIAKRAAALMPSVGAVVLSDYAKGALTPALTARLIALARDAGRPVVVDPKGDDYGCYGGADLLTPNRRELAEATNMPVATDDDLAAAAAALRDRHGVKAVLVTRGAEGMSLFGEAGARYFPAEAQEVFDVSGAGDTVAATIAGCLAAGFPLPDATRIANLAAGIVVGKLGTAVVRAEELYRAIFAENLMAAEAKVVGLAEAVERVERWRAEGRKIGFTNGCFDLLHPGHVSLIDQARNHCDRLVVGLNSDDSVRRLKGNGRPVQDEAARGAVLASLANVDLVVVFDEDTPMGLLRGLKPETLVKGADYDRADVVGGDLVESYGGRVVLADILPGFSTTATLSRLAK